MDTRAEWLEPDGLGGYASGTVCGIRTRRYHALLLTATTPPTGRVVLVNGFDAWVQTASGAYALSSQDYTPGVTHPDGAQRMHSFEWDPWPRWRFRLEDGTEIEQELFVPKGYSAVAVSWRLAKQAVRRVAGKKGGAQGDAGVALSVRPLLSGRDYHALHRENGSFSFQPDEDASRSPEAPNSRGEIRLIWRPYPKLPSIVVVANGSYEHQPDWYRSFLYEQERERGLESTEDLATPGIFRWDLTKGDAVWLLAAEVPGGQPVPTLSPVVESFKKLRSTEQARRRKFPPGLPRSADAYLVRRGQGLTIVAGYPWFTDWGRDTFISLRGLCLATGRLDVAKDILLEWSGTVSEGMLPNRFPDRGEAPEYNSVDASLWYIIAVHDFLQASRTQSVKVPAGTVDLLRATAEEILASYTRGTRYQIKLDQDGLLAAGEPGVQLTWMDAKIGDYVVTPRIGKPVEVQALWLNALLIASEWSDRWKGVFERGRESFRSRFWSEDGYLYDVVDCNHQPGTVDPAFRPNQILAIGGLPAALLEGEQARGVVEAVEARLWTPLGLRSLAPSEPGYHPYYRGTLSERDGAYHQGVVWPWLVGPFVEAWLRVRGGTRKAMSEARTRFLPPLQSHLEEAGLGHISEITDAEPPFTPRGCPFQAWSVGEALRLTVLLEGQSKPEPKATSKRAPSPAKRIKRKI
jgi:predicted glycogen debranching enzyme